MKGKACLNKEQFDNKSIVYNGSRPIQDECNETRTQLCSFFFSSASIHEIYPHKFYLAYVKDSISRFKNRLNTKYLLCPFRFTRFIRYDSFNYDFGPLNLGAIHMYISNLKVLLDTLPYRNEECVVVVVDDRCPKRTLNATFLVAATALTLFNMTDTDVIKSLQFSFMHPNCKDRNKPVHLRQPTRFSDVSGFMSQVKISVEDCISAFYLAIERKFYNYYTFDHMEYLFYEMVQTGDINWIVPGKLLAFAGPSENQSVIGKHPPSFYIDYFKERNITDIVRLNEPDYNMINFTQVGFKHHDLIFPDGLPPTSTIALRFMKIVDDAQGAVAVHCFAGIGRTGTLIAAYLVTKYGFTPESAIAWTRICRPGSVIGDQQDWLLRYFEKRSTCFKQNKHSPETDKPTIQGTTEQSTNNENNNNNDAQTMTFMTWFESASTSTKKNLIDPLIQCEGKPSTDYQATEKELGQARALVQTKQKRKGTTPLDCSTKETDTKQYTIKTRASSKRKINTEVTTNKQQNDNKMISSEKSQPFDKTEIILDLGKTLPIRFLCSSMSDYSGLGNYPQYYVLHDGQLTWKVKFPHPDYVKLNLKFNDHNIQSPQLEDDGLEEGDDIEEGEGAQEENKKKKEQVIDEPEFLPEFTSGIDLKDKKTPLANKICPEYKPSMTLTQGLYSRNRRLYLPLNSDDSLMAFLAEEFG